MYNLAHRHLQHHSSVAMGGRCFFRATSKIDSSFIEEVKPTSPFRFYAPLTAIHRPSFHWLNVWVAKLKSEVLGSYSNGPKS